MSSAARPNPPAPDPSLEPQARIEWFEPDYRTHRRAWIQLALLLIVVVAAYIPAMRGGFLWQDDRAITANESIRSWRTVAAAWLHPRSQHVWQPAATTFLWPQHLLWRDWNPTGYRVVCVGLHMLNVLLLWLLLRRLGLRAAWLAAALFALHPVAVHAVAWSAQQPVLLATCFSLLAALTWLRWNDLDAASPPIEGAWNLAHRPWLMASLTVMLFLAALLTDAAISAAVPVALLLLAWWKQGRIDAPSRRRTIPLLILSALVTAIVLWARQSPSGDLAIPPPAAGITALGFHAITLILPYPLLISYARWNTGPALWFAAIIVIAVLAAIWVLRRRLGRDVLAAVSIFVALLLPAVFLFDSRGGGFVTDAQQYLARTALLALAATAAGWLITAPADDSDARDLRPFAATAIIALLAALTFFQARLTRSSEIAWANVAAHDPDSRIARAELGGIALSMGHPDEAAEQLRHLVDNDPNDVDARLRLGDILLAQSHPEDALRQFKQAVRLRPTDTAVWRRVAAAAAQNQDIPEAVANYRKALELDPRDDLARNNLATLYARQGDAGHAIAEFQQALKDNPHSTASHLNLANLLFSLGRFEEAAGHLQDAVKIDPNNFDAYLSAGAMLMNFKNFHEASRMFQQALLIRRDSPQAYNLLGVSQAAQGMFTEAIYNFGRALDLKPDFESAKQNLQAAQAQRDGTPATTQSSPAPTEK